VELSKTDKRALENLTTDVRIVEAHRNILDEGERPKNAHAIMDGFSCRYKLLPDGKRQILDFIISGDICDGHMIILAKMDHSVGTLTRCNVAYMPHKALFDVTEKHPKVAQALWWIALVQESIAREWLANIGRRPHAKRLAHLLCELSLRLEAVGLTEDHGYALPITQADLADATGMSAVHANRILQRLRRDDLIAFHGNSLEIKNIERLKDFAQFNSTYLHPMRRSP
jgi:CRP-like cAMP-binding protein